MSLFPCLLAYLLPTCCLYYCQDSIYARDLGPLELPAWYSSIFPFPLGVLHNSQNEAFCDLTPAYLSNLSSLLNTNKAILSGGFVYLLLIYMENATAHLNVHFH